MLPWNLGKPVICAVIGLALIAALVSIAIFLTGNEQQVAVAAGGVAQRDMIPDDPSCENLFMVLLAFDLNCALVVILMAFIFPQVAKFKKPAVVGLALIAGIAIFLQG